MRRTPIRSDRVSFSILAVFSSRRTRGRRFRATVDRLEDRTLLSTVTWINPSGGDWDDPSMWSGGVVPGAADDAVISFSDITITHDTSASDTVDSLTCDAALDISDGSLTIDTTSSAQPASIVSGEVDLSGASLSVLSGSLDLTGGGTLSGNLNAGAGTSLSLNGLSLTPRSAIASAGNVGLGDCTVEGSYNCAGVTDASDTIFTGAVSLGSALNVDNVAFTPAAGGPVTLTTGSMSVNDTLSGTDSFVANGLLALNSSCTLSVPEIDAYGGMDVDAFNPITLNGTTLNNFAAATWDFYGGPSSSVLESGAVINNLSGASLTIEGNSYGGIVAGDSSAVTFNNAGSLIYSKTGINDFEIEVPSTNTGSVDVLQGGFGLGGTGTTTSTGTFTVDAGGSLGINGQVLTPSSSITSAGNVGLGGCTVEGSYNCAGVTDASDTIFTGAVSLGSALNVDNVAFTPAAGGPVTLTTGSMSVNDTLSGTDSFVANGLLALNSSCTLSVPEIDAYGGMDVDAFNPITLNGTTLNNFAAATWDFYGGPSSSVLESGAVINNLSGASLTIEGNSYGGIVAGDSSAVAFNNAGSLIYSKTGINDFEIEVPSTNTGSVDVLQGSFGLGGTGTTTSTGTFTVDAGGSLGINGQVLTPSSSITSAGNVGLGDCTVEGSYNCAGVTDASDTIFTGAVSLGSALNVDNVAFTPAAGGPVTLTTGSMSVNDTLSGTDSFVANGLLRQCSTPVALSASRKSTPTAEMDVDAFNPITLNGTTLNNFAAATWDFYGGPSSSVLESGAVINNLSGASLTIEGNSYGGIVAGDSSAVTFNNAGSLIYSKTGINDFEIEVPSTNTGSVDVLQGSFGLDDVTNSGMIAVESGGTLGVGSYVQSSGETILYGGTINGGSLDIDAGALSGWGTINADVFNAGQTIMGGTGMAGALVINGNYTQTAAGALDVGIGGLTAGSQYGQLAVSGAAALAGTVNVALLSGFQPVAGDLFEPLTFASSTGEFGFYNGNVLGNRLILDPSLNPTNLTLTVQPAVTTTTMAVPPSPSVSGQSVTFTAIVTVALPPTTIEPVPTGAVTFYDGGTSIGTGTLNFTSGQDEATLTTSALGAGTHAITAAYTSGDANFVPSAPSAAVTQVVNKDNTTTTAGASPSSANLGQTVTFTATVTANTPGSGTPTGTVDFFDTTTNTDLTPGGVGLSSGTATFATTSLTAGPHTIKATYSGDGNFITSYATTGTVTVGQSIIVLDPSAGGALSISGNASINLPGGVYVNSSSSTALSASGNAKIKATVIDVHGGVSKIGNASFSPTPTTGAAVAADPYASLAEPSTSGLTNYGSESLSGNASATIKPGVYSGISVSGNGTLTLDSGLYVIEGGGFSISGNASVTGSDVTIFNAGNKYPTTGGTYGGISLSGNGTYNLTPPTSGTYAGIVIFQSRDNSKALTISGNASGMNGTIYAPAAALTESGNAQLSASIDVDTLTISGNGVSNTVAPSSPAGTVAYSPAQIRSAYGISSLAYDGTGETIAIVDAYDDPSILQGVDAFDSQFGLTTSGPTLYQQYGPASSFLTVLNQVGQATSLPSTDPNGPGTDNWEVEEALDVEWMHAIAPGAQIILVEATSQSLSDLMAGVATAAAQPGVSVVSMSWGFAEGQAVFAGDEAAYDNVFNVPGVTFVASTGDYGAADPEYPAFSPNVVAVGGTSLTLNGDGSYGGETGWGYLSSPAGTFIGSGGGISLYESEPAYQQGVQSTGMRTTPDVSLVADPATGAWIADTYNLDPSNPFEVVGGTSLSAPAWAGLVALVNQGRAAAGESTLNSSSPTETQQALYMLPQSDYNAISGGTNGYTAGAGYNLVTGLGTPVANLLVPDLVAYDGPGTTYSGPTVGALQNANLVNAGMSDSGPMDVFSVFDSLTVTSNGVNRNGAVTTVDTKVDRGLARPLPGTERTAIPTLDRALEVLQDENVQETLIGDLAFEQVAKDPRRA